MLREELAHTFGGFKTESVLGRGQFGTVYAARHIDDGSIVALKVLDPELCTDADVRRRFVREGYATRRFDHPNVVACISASDTDEPRLWIAFELIDGVPLSRLLSADIELSRQIDWLKQILAGLQHLHDCGGVHRDVKPANVMIETQANGVERAVVVDLGLTSFTDLEEAVSSEEGTPAYLAPELVVSGTAPSAQSDVYAAGVILFEFLESKLPFDGAHGVAVALQHVTEPIPRLGTRLPARTRSRWQAIVDRALAKDPALRFLSADEFRATLNDASLPEDDGIDMSQPSDFSVALDAALVSARRGEQTQDRRPANVHVEKALFPASWRACEAYLRKCASLPGRHLMTVKSRNQARTARFIYHLAKHIQTEGYFQVVFPEFERHEQHLVSVNSEQRSVGKHSVGVARGDSPRLLVYLSTEPESAELSSSTGASVVVLAAVDGREPSTVFELSEPNVDNAEHWLIDSMNVERSLARSLTERTHGNVEMLLALLEFLLISGQVDSCEQGIVLSSLAKPSGWPNDGESLTADLAHVLLCSDFGSNLAYRLMWCGVALGAAWREQVVAEVLLENGVSIEHVPPLLALSQYLGSLNASSSPALLFDGAVTRRRLLDHLPDNNRSRECLNSTLRILLQLSDLSVGEMMAIVRIRKILGEGGRAVEDAKRFMGMLAVRGALTHAVRLGETIDQLWDGGVFVDDLERAETWLRVSGFCLGCGQYEKASKVSSRVAQWAKQLNHPTIFADALFQVGMVAAAQGDWEKARIAMERSLRQIDGVNADEHAGQRRVWQYKWVLFWFVSHDEPKFSQSIEAFLANRSVLMGFQERIRVYTKVLVENRLGPLGEKHREALSTWLREVTLGTA
ncbi:MAG: serine/threonine-protein kinase [Bradymonadia bacterium]